MQQLMTIVSATLAFNGVVLAFFAWAYSAPRFAEQRLNRVMAMRESWPKRVRNMAQTSVISVALVLGFAYVGGSQLVYEQAVSPLRAVGEAALVLVVYDFAYYWLHRFMHHKRVMKYVHNVHHRARNPSALDSFYQHPVECVLGIVWLYGSVWAVGPVSVPAFAIVFVVFTTMNIVVHSGLDFGKAWLKPIDFLARKHHVHHYDDFDKNFASLTPLPDLLFGTSK